jgi:hypothetical protein
MMAAASGRGTDAAGTRAELTEPLAFLAMCASTPGPCWTSYPVSDEAALARMIPVPLDVSLGFAAKTSDAAIRTVKNNL